MTLTWLGHSCFMLESYGFRALIDPFHDVKGLPDTNTSADAVYCSHGHFDHAYTDEITLSSGDKVNPFTVREISAFHDDQNGALRGRNTIRIFTSEGVTVVHLGDLGHQLSPRQLEEIGRCDVLLLPVGGTYTVDYKGAREVAAAVNPAVIVPMHFREGTHGFDILTTREDFLDQYPVDRIRRYPGNTMEIYPNMPKQIAVLKLP